MAEDRSTDGHWEQRVRQGAEAFDFSTLIGGVSTRNQSPPETTGQPGPTEAGELRHMSLPSYAVAVDHALQPPPQRAGSPVLWVLAGVLATAAMAVVALAVVKLVVHPSPPAVSSMQASVASTSTPKTVGNPEKGMPDSVLTPGDQDRAAATSAPPPEDVRTRVMKLYGLDPSNRRYVLCQLIPEAFGGTNRPANLFPTTPWFTDLKGRLDRRLTELVAAGTITEKQAITELRTNWVAAVHGHYVRNYGHQDHDNARKTEDTLRW
jgi:hypothetical protein